MIRNHHFFSGVGRLAHFQGAFETGAGIGIVITGTSKNVLNRAANATATNLVFVDSGAFTAFTKGIKMDWDDVMRRYLELAKASSNPHNLFLVAPDVIGDGIATIEYQIAYMEKLQTLAGYGANIIFPMQRGASLDEMKDMWSIINREMRARAVVGIPSNKRAWEAAEAAEIIAPLRPVRVHLLGIGPGAPRWQEFKEKLEGTGLDLTVYTDSVPSGFRDFSVNQHCKALLKEIVEMWEEYDDTELFRDALEDLSPKGLEMVAKGFGLDSFGIKVGEFIEDVLNGLDLDDKYGFLLTEPYSSMFDEWLRKAAREEANTDNSLYRIWATKHHITDLKKKYNQ